MHSFVFCGLDRLIVNAHLKPACYDNSKMVNNLTVGQKLSVWQDFLKFRILNTVLWSFVFVSSKFTVKSFFIDNWNRAEVYVYSKDDKLQWIKDGKWFYEIVFIKCAISHNRVQYVPAINGEKRRLLNVQFVGTWVMATLWEIFLWTCVLSNTLGASLQRCRAVGWRSGSNRVSSSNQDRGVFL